MRLKTTFMSFFSILISMTPTLSKAGFIEKKNRKNTNRQCNTSNTEKAYYRAKRQKAIDDYLKKNKKGMDLVLTIIQSLESLPLYEFSQMYFLKFGAKSNYMEKTGLLLATEKRLFFLRGIAGVDQSN